MSAPCPHCPVSSRTFSSHGLKVHIGRAHKDVVQSRAHPSRSALQAKTLTNLPGSDNNTQSSLSSSHGSTLDNLATLRNSVRVLRHVPKGARSLAAAKLCEFIDKAIDSNDTSDWCAMLTFAYSGLRTPDLQDRGNLTTKVKSNIDNAYNFNSEYTNEADSSPRSSSVLKTIESKVFEGDLRGAVRVLMSEDTIAPPGPETLASLQSKHPSPSRPLIFPQRPDGSTPALIVKVEDVVSALNSFHSGSAGGLDGIRPAHLKELTSSSAGDNGQRLVGSLVKLCNFLLKGQLNPEVCPYMYGAALCAFSKKEGGIRPIAVGSVFRRLVAKLGCRAVREEMAAYLRPHQLGFGTQQGCEAAIHATRAFAMEPGSADKVIIKLDVKNAFNSVERDVLLTEVSDKVPALFPFLDQVYHTPSNLIFDKTLILSQVGAQQGDPLGPLVFSLSIHKAISSLKSPLNVWYLDDGTIGGSPEDVKQDILTLLPLFKDIGLEVNSAKCEIFCCGPTSSTVFPSFSSLLPGLREIFFRDFTLLGSPIFTDALPDALEAGRHLLLLAHERLKGISAHVALVLLRMCLAVPKLTYLLRTAPTWLFPESVFALNETLRCTVESILNVSLSQDQWSQASLPIRYGGLGVRGVGDVSLPAFLASANGVAALVSEILSSQGGSVSIPHAADALNSWMGLFPTAPVPQNRMSQRAWDEVGCKMTLDRLMGEASGVHLARLRTVSKAGSGAWVQALPTPYAGTLLDNDSMRVAVALRLGCDVCEEHKCICGSTVEANGHHALSCRRCMGRFPRHHALNDIVRRALISANVPCVLEPPGLSRSDGKRPDGLTLVPWQRGKSLLWDATCVSTFATSNLARTVQAAGAAAEVAAAKKHVKYAGLADNYIFVPLAFETTGCWGTEAFSLVKEIGRRLRERGHDARSGSYLAQRLSIAIQRGNAASIAGTFAAGTIRGGLFD